MDDIFEGELKHLLLFISRKCVSECSHSRSSSRGLGVTHPCHPCSHYCLQVWLKVTSYLGQESSHRFVCGLSHSVIIVLSNKSMYMSICDDIDIHIHMYMHTQTHTHTRAHTHTHSRTQTHTRTRTHTHTHAYKNTHKHLLYSIY